MYVEHLLFKKKTYYRSDGSKRDEVLLCKKHLTSSWRQRTKAVLHGLPSQGAMDFPLRGNPDSYPCVGGMGQHMAAVQEHAPQDEERRQ